jgi:hypothetical protein
VSDGCVENGQLFERGYFYPFELTLFLTTNQDKRAIASPHIKDQKIAAFGSSYRGRVGPMRELPKAAIPLL